MKIFIENGFITDNSKDCNEYGYFIKTKTNAIYEKDAINSGAKIINIEECKKLLRIDENINIIGITGTNGKTTTAFGIYETLLKMGYKCAIAGTRGAFYCGERIGKKGLTTEQILSTLGYLAYVSEKKCDFFVMEVSSHAISQNRIEGLNFALKIFTNLSQDHLDYHKNFEDYKKTKESFFTDKSKKLINLDDENNINFNKENAKMYSIKRDTDFSITNFTLKNRISFTVKNGNEIEKINSNLQGEFNMYNLLAIYSAIKILIPKEKIAKYINEFMGVSGRMEIVNQKPLVIVDFAHTPDGIEKVLNSLKHLNLIVVFGAGGDRDKSKRPQMGKIVQKYAKQIIITSDNPRNEDPKQIIEDIYSQMQTTNNIHKIENRKEAIKFALNLQKENEILIILGKGDEECQEIAGQKIEFNDKKVVSELING